MGVLVECRELEKEDLMRMRMRTAVVAGTIAVAGITGFAFVRPALLSASASTSAGTASPTPASSAQPDQPKPGPPDHLRERLKDVLADLVKAGTLTQKQADAVAEKLGEIGIRGPQGRGGPHLHLGGSGFEAALDTAAKALGITTDELRTALRNGDTLAEVAQRQKVAVAKIVDALVAAATQRLDDAVADGRLPQARADRLKAQLHEQFTRLVNRGLPERGWPAPGHPAVPSLS